MATSEIGSGHIIISKVSGKLEKIHTLALGEAEPEHLCFSGDNTHVAALCINPETEICDTKVWKLSTEPKLIASLPSGDYSAPITLSIDGKFIIRGSADFENEVYSLEVKPEKLAESVDLKNPCQTTFSADSRYMLRFECMTIKTILHHLQTKTRASIELTDQDLVAHGLDADLQAFMADDGNHVVLQSSDYIRVYNLSGPEPTRIDVWASPETQEAMGERFIVGPKGFSKQNLDANPNLITGMCAKPKLFLDGLFLVTSHGTGVKLWDIAPRQPED